MSTEPETERENPEAVDPVEYIRKKAEYEEMFDSFMRKHLRREWPVCFVAILGVLQLLLSLTILGVDLPIVLMFAPRWEVFAGCWTFVLTFIACVSTLHSSKRFRYKNLKFVT